MSISSWSCSKCSQRRTSAKSGICCAASTLPIADSAFSIISSRDSGAQRASSGHR